MKTTIIVFAVMLLGVSTASAAISLLKDVKIAEVGNDNYSVDVYKIEDKAASTTCYVTMMGKFGGHAVSCVK